MRNLRDNIIISSYLHTPWPPSWRRYFMKGLFLFFFIVITILSLVPAPDDSSTGSVISQWLARLFLGSSAHSDKVMHFVAYGVLMGTAILGRLSIKGHSFWIMIAIIFWSALMEIAQYYTGYRSLDGWDLMANSMGTLSGFLSGCMIITIYDAIRIKRL